MMQLRVMRNVFAILKTHGPPSHSSGAKAFLESIRGRLDEYITIGKEHDTDVLLEYVEGVLKHADLITG